MAEEQNPPPAPPQEEQQQRQRRSLLPPLSKIPRLSSDASGAVTMAAPSPLGLGLRLGLGGGYSRPAFTFMQLQELEHQALIYKYMVAGVPVPLHLVLPIWKSVAASSYGPHHCPSFMGYGSLCLDYRNSMEPEPGRCRRTDGKKWRCSRDVVPDQKYCERHMHRGRNRSRKPVEAGAGAAAAASTATATPAATTLQVEANNNGSNTTTTTTTTTYLSIAIPSGGGLHLMPTTNSSSSSSGGSNNVSPPRLGFSPTSVLQGGTACKAGPS